MSYDIAMTLLDEISSVVRYCYRSRIRSGYNICMVYTEEETIREKVEGV